ncbi:MAG: GMP/IMP nucleotidase [Thermodesulfobacteriota bacterium]
MEPEQRRATVDWRIIDTVLLDMDGTLLDRHFDDYFWEHYVPEVYAGKHAIPIDQARRELLSRYQGREGTLDWTDLDYWSNQLGLDIPALKMKINHLIGVHPYVVDFLKFCRENGKQVHLVTNAHSKTLAIKMQKTALAPYFDQIVCAEQIGVAKEDPAFWPWLEQHLGFSRQQAMFADDNEGVLDSAATFGFGALIFVARPSSTRPVRYSARYPSIVTFRELIPPVSLPR